MFPTFPDAPSKPEFEELMRRLSPVKAESSREFWTICEVLQAMKEAEYPWPLWCCKSTHLQLRRELAGSLCMPSRARRRAKPERKVVGCATRKPDLRC